MRLVVWVLLCAVNVYAAAYRLPSEYKNFRWGFGATLRSAFESNYARRSRTEPIEPDASLVAEPTGNLSYARRGFEARTALRYSVQRYLGLFNVPASTRQTIDTTSGLKLSTRSWTGLLEYNYNDTDEPQIGGLGTSTSISGDGLQAAIFGNQELGRELVPRYSYYVSLHNRLSAVSERLEIEVFARTGKFGYLGNTGLQHLNAREHQVETGADWQLFPKLSLGGSFIYTGQRPTNPINDGISRRLDRFVLMQRLRFAPTTRLKTEVGLGFNASLFGDGQEFQPAVNASLRYVRGDIQDAVLQYRYDLQQAATSQYILNHTVSISTARKVTRVMRISSGVAYSHLKYGASNIPVNRKEQLVRVRAGIVITPMRLNQLNFLTQYLFEVRDADRSLITGVANVSESVGVPYNNHTMMVGINWRY